MAVRRRLTPPRAALALMLFAWLAVGLVAVRLYVHRYDVYRGFPPPATPAGVVSGTERHVSFYSRALHQTRRYDVYLPPRYAALAARGRRFGVLYLLHGWPGQPQVFLSAGAMGVDESVEVARHQAQPMILVMPQGKHSFLHGDTEWANAGAGRWMDFVVEVVHDVDHRFATLADRQHRGIAGLSEGGYGALNIALHHLRMFSVAESWSGYFRQTPTSVFAGATPAQVRANSPADVVPALAPRIRRLGIRVWLYQGAADSASPAAMRGFAAELGGAGADVRYGFFPGGHDWGLWRRQAPRMLLAAAHWFAQRPAGQAGLRGVGKPLSLAARRRFVAARKRHCLAEHATRHSHFGLSCRRWRRQAGLRI